MDRPQPLLDEGKSMSRRDEAAARPAFTLIELMVVVAIVALLVSMLLPSLSQARQQAKAIKCAANLKMVGTAVATYTTEFAAYPASYLYPTDARSSYSYPEQDVGHPYGYLHWSYYLYSSGKCKPEAFQCPDYPNGGAPRTNPGPNPADWERGQADQNGDCRPNALTDKQAPRIAYTANAAIIPRNKFTPQMSGGQRVNVFVKDTKLDNPGRTILATELFRSWRATTDAKNEALVKSHRPVNPFYHLGSGTDEYKAPLHTPGFMYGPQGDPNCGIKPLAAIQGKHGLIDGSAGPETNAVGRHHPGGDRVLGGTANFLYADAHAERKTVLQTMKKREWGKKYYSLTGANEVLGMSR